MCCQCHNSQMVCDSDTWAHRAAISPCKLWEGCQHVEVLWVKQMLKNHQPITGIRTKTSWCSYVGGHSSVVRAVRNCKKTVPTLSCFLFKRTQPLAVREYTCNLCASRHTAAAFIPTPRLAPSACKHKILCVATGVSVWLDICGH